MDFRNQVQKKEITKNLRMKKVKKMERLSDVKKLTATQKTKVLGGQTEDGGICIIGILTD